MKKTAIVTGSSRGIGFAIARQLGLDGYNIVMVATGAQEKNQPALDTLQALGIDCAYVQANIGCTDDRKKILDTALAAFGRVDVLVNNTQEASDATNMITGAAGRADVPVVDVSEQMPKDADTLNAWINQLINTIIDAVDPSYGCEDATDGDTADSNANSDDSSAEGSATDDANAQDSKASTGSSTDPKYIRQCKAAASSDSSQDSAKADAANGDSGDASGNDQTDSGK